MQSKSYKSSGLSSLLLSSIISFNLFVVSVIAEPPTARIIDGSPASETLYPNVARLALDGDLLCTGTLVGPRHILTAAHCFFDERNHRGVGDTAVVARLGGQQVRSSKIFIHPTYKSRSSACVEGETDAAMVELSSSVEGISPINLVESPPAIGSSLLLVGYGTQGSGANGEDGSIPSDGIVNVGNTTLEGYGENPPKQNPNSTYFFWSFEGGEANTASGDSGGPAFIRSGSETLIAGITCGGNGNAEIGTNSFNTRADLIKSWVQSFTGGTPSNTAPGFTALPAKSVSKDQAFSYTIPVTGSQTIQLAANGLPSGLVLTNKTISGAPTVAGVYNVELVATNPFGSASTTLKIIVSSYQPSLKIKKALLQFDSGGRAQDFLDVSGSINVGTKFNPKNQKIIVKIGRFSKTFTLDANGQSKGNPISYFDLDGDFKGSVFKKAVVRFDLTLERATIFDELSTLGFPTSDIASNGQQVPLPINVTIKGVDSSFTSILSFRESDARWRVAK